MSILRKRELKHPALVARYPMARGFYAPQRDHIKQPMPARDARPELRKVA